MIKFPKKGQPVWMFVNGRPAKRYFVHGVKYRRADNTVSLMNCVVSFTAKGKEHCYVDCPVFYDSKVEAIAALINAELGSICDHTERVGEMLKGLLTEGNGK